MGCSILGTIIPLHREISHNLYLSFYVMYVSILVAVYLVGVNDGHLDLLVIFPAQTGLQSCLVRPGSARAPTVPFVGILEQ